MQYQEEVIISSKESLEAHSFGVYVLFFNFLRFLNNVIIIIGYGLSRQ